jgi:hypothetical protein
MLAASEPYREQDVVFQETQLGVGKDGDEMLPGSLRIIVSGGENMGKSWDCIVEDSDIKGFFARVYRWREGYRRI